MNSLKKILISAAVVAFWMVPLVSAEQNENGYLEKVFYDDANEEFVALESTDIQAATPFVEIEETYWTEDRLMNAMPYPQPELDGEPASIDLHELQSDILAGGTSAGSLSLGDKANKKLSALSEEEDAVAIAGGDTATLAYPPPHQTFYVPTNKYSIFPYKTVGKVFFSSGGQNYVCSGSSIGGRAVLTAGHCVSSGSGQWHSNWRFVPAYSNGSAPYGIWSAFWLGTFSVWHQNQNLCRDVGFAAVSDRSGYKLSQYVGYLGFAWNQNRNLSWSMFGYPAANPYDGKWMVQTNASFSKSDNPNCTPYTVGMGTNQTGGTSGGPRIWRFVEGSAGSNNYANGVNSYIYTSRPLELFSPYFDTSVNNLRNYAVGR